MSELKLQREVDRLTQELSDLRDRYEVLKSEHEALSAQRAAQVDLAKPETVAAEDEVTA